MICKKMIRSAADNQTMTSSAQLHCKCRRKSVQRRRGAAQLAGNVGSNERTSFGEKTRLCCTSYCIIDLCFNSSRRANVGRHQTCQFRRQHRGDALRGVSVPKRGSVSALVTAVEHGAKATPKRVEVVAHERTGAFRDGDGPFGVRTQGRAEGRRGRSILPAIRRNRVTMSLRLGREGQEIDVAQRRERPESSRPLELFRKSELSDTLLRAGVDGKDERQFFRRFDEHLQ